MAVFTPVPRKELEKMLMYYDIGSLVNYEGIEEGIENTNYLVETDKGRYILTLFETRTRASALPFCFRFMDHLHAGGISCPTVIKDVYGYETRMLCSRPASILSFVEGRPVAQADLMPDHCYKIGAYQARMHKASAGLDAFRANPMGFDEWNALYCKTASRADSVQDGLAEMMIDTLVDIREGIPSKLPSGPIHGDLFPDNVFFNDAGEISAVIDFYFSCNEAYLYDACLTFNAWCGNADFTLDAAKGKAFWAGYQSVRPLQQLERKYFPLMRKAAAIRILSTRLHDWLFPPEDENVVLTPKNPKEYIIKLQWPDDQVREMLISDD